MNEFWDKQEKKIQSALALPPSLLYGTPNYDAEKINIQTFLSKLNCPMKQKGLFFNETEKTCWWFKGEPCSIENFEICDKCIHMNNEERICKK